MVGEKFNQQVIELLLDFTKIKIIQSALP